jgi:N-methylhydantoinase A
MAAKFRVGVDIGGAFTDIVFLGDDGSHFIKKVSSTVDDYAKAIAEGLAELMFERNVRGGDIVELLHDTTVASNAILELKGVRTGLITTKGFRDVLEIRTLRMPRLYDISWTKPPPLAERHLRREVDERVNWKGEIERPLHEDDVERVVQQLLDAKVKAIAVCLLHSYANPTHEKQITAIIECIAPHLTLCISADVLPEIKEYERTSTTTINAYVRPIVATYLASLMRSRRLRAARWQPTPTCRSAVSPTERHVGPGSVRGMAGWIPGWSTAPILLHHTLLPASSRNMT